MEGSEGEQAQSSSTRNWDELFHLFAHVIVRENDALKIKAMIKLAKISRYAPEHILALAVPILLELLGSIPSPLIQEASAHCLKCIACQCEGTLANLIGQSGAVPILLRLLPNSQEALQRVLLKCLRNLVTFAAPNRIILASNGGLDIILAILSFSSSDDSKLIIVEMLSALALIREVRKSLWSSRRVHYLVEAARCGSLVSRTRAAHAIGLLGLIKKARRSLVDSGAIVVLMNLLKEGDPSSKLIAANALGVISSHVDHIRPIAQAGVIPLYAELLQSSDPIGNEIAEDVFCVLSVDEENAITVVEHLVGILRGDSAGARAAAADVIWDLSSYKFSFPVLRDSVVIQVLVELLSDESVEVRERVAGAVAQLSHGGADRDVLADSGAIPRLIGLLGDECDEVRDNAAEALVNFWSDPVHGDRVSGVLENPSFRNMRERLMEIPASDEHMVVLLRQINVEHLMG